MPCPALWFVWWGGQQRPGGSVGLGAPPHRLVLSNWARSTGKQHQEEPSRGAGSKRAAVPSRETSPRPVPSPICWPFSTGDALFAHRLRVPPAGTARAEHAGTARHTEPEGRGDRGAVCPGRCPPELAPVLPGQGMCFGGGACCCPSSRPDGGFFGDRAERISLFLSWNGSIYSFHAVLR